jgi:hypothetical protein
MFMLDLNIDLTPPVSEGEGDIVTAPVNKGDDVTARVTGYGLGVKKAVVLEPFGPLGVPLVSLAFESKNHAWIWIRAWRRENNS